MKLFVYGTLRRGAAMHGLLEGRVSYLGAATAPGLLLDLGAFPALAHPSGPGDRVHGDLFAIATGAEAVLLDTLDRYEGASFAREEAVVAGPDGECRAWLYRWRGNPRGCRIVPGGDYLATPGSETR